MKMLIVIPLLKILDINAVGSAITMEINAAVRSSTDFY